MLYAIIRTEDGDIYGATFENMRQYNAATFSPYYMPVFVCDLDNVTTWGKSYGEKKHTARETAVLWQSLMADGFCPSYMDLAIAGDYFTALGRKYGLLREFRENGIC